MTWINEQISQTIPFCPPLQQSCGRGILDYPSSVRPFPLNNFKSFGWNLMILHTGVSHGGFRTLYAARLIYQPSPKLSKEYGLVSNISRPLLHSKCPRSLQGGLTANVKFHFFLGKGSMHGFDELCQAKNYCLCVCVCLVARPKHLSCFSDCNCLDMSVLKTRQNHCLSAGRVTFVTCPPWQKVARPHTDFTIKILAIYEKLPVCRTGWVSYLPAHIIFYPLSGGRTGSIFNTGICVTCLFIILSQITVD